MQKDIIRYIKENFNNLSYPFLLWNIIFLFLLVNFNLGFDLTDEGWQLSKSWGILHGNLSNNADLIWGSSFVNGIWLWIYGTPLLIWSRLGYLLFLPFFGVVIYSILIMYYPKKQIFFSILTAFFLFNKLFLIYPVVNYYYLPVFSSLLFFLFLIKFHKSEKFSIKFLILSGLFAGISVHLKFTYILIIPLFLIYFFSFYESKNNKLKPLIIFYGSLLGAVLLGFILIMIFGGAQDLVYQHNRLSIFNMFGYFFGNTQGNSSLNYSAGNLLSLYMKDFLIVVKDSMFFLTLFFISSYLVVKNSKLKYLLISLSGAFLFIYTQGASDSHLKLIEIIFSSVILLSAFAINLKNEFIILNFIFISVFLLSFLGSGTAFYGGIFSLGFFGFTAFILTSTLYYESEIIYTKLLFYSILILAVIAQFGSYTPYRDLSPTNLNTMFRSPELFGIYSFKERVETVDEFMEFAKSNRIKSEKVIFVAMPMFYYLLDVKPVISETHDVILGFEQLKKEVTEAFPNIIVMPVQSPRGTFWPLEQNKDFWTKDGFERNVSHYYKFYNEYIAENNFEKVFENKMFIVYRKTGLLRE